MTSIVLISVRCFDRTSFVRSTRHANWSVYFAMRLYCDLVALPFPFLLRFFAFRITVAGSVLITYANTLFA
jgi:hypothetical protein